MTKTTRAWTVSLLLLALPGTGCGLIYKNSHSGAAFTLYSDRSEEFLESVAERTNAIYAGLERVFDLPESRLSRTAIVLEGEESSTVDYRHSPDILGYYIPLLSFISIDTAPCSQRGELLDQVLLHEISHHFIVTQWPPASGECWLNEGLAGAIEMSVFEAGRFECPLLNPVLFQVAQREAYSKEAPVSLGDLVGMGWSTFHSKQSKERNYALAWSAVYFILERHLPRDLPIGKRIDMLYRMDRSAIAELEPQWVAFLRGFDIAGHMLALARDSSPEKRLSSAWAARQLGGLHSQDDLRILEGLAWLFDDHDPVKRLGACLSFLQKLERAPHSYFLAQSSIQRGIERIGMLLEDPVEPEPLREAVAVALGASFKTREQWIYPLVALLDGGDGDLRAAAARTLSRIAEKPTIVNPAFWRAAPAPDREREVAEWHHWLAAQDQAGEALQ